MMTNLDALAFRSDGNVVMASPCRYFDALADNHQDKMSWIHASCGVSRCAWGRGTNRQAGTINAAISSIAIKVA